MLWIDLWNDQGHIRIKAVRRRICDHEVSSFTQALLPQTSDICRQRRKHEPAARAIIQVSEDQILEVWWTRSADTLAQRLSCRFRGCANIYELKPGMVRQNLQEALTNHSCRTVEGYREAFFSRCLHREEDAKRLRPRHAYKRVLSRSCQRFRLS